MAVVQITDVKVLDNPSAFTNPFSFQITFQCLQELPEDIEWKVTYVGSASDENYDQVLEEVLVGPLVVGVNSFVLQTTLGINYANIPQGDILGVTVVLVTCSYMEREFVRIGYYVRNEYTVEYDPENPPNPLDINLVARTILDDQPRVTYFAIDWGVGAPQDLYPPQQDEEPQNTQEGGDDAVMQNTEEDVISDDIDEEGEDEEDEEEEEDSTGDMEIDINEDSMDVEGMQNGAMTAH